MNLLPDTNILLHLSKDVDFRPRIKIINRDNQRLYISVVSLAELKSLGLQYGWGVKN